MQGGQLGRTVRGLCRGLRVGSDCDVNRIASLAELGDRCLVGNGVHEVAGEEMGVAAAGHDLLGNPLQVFAGIVAVRKQINRVLDRNRTRRREALAICARILARGRDMTAGERDAVDKAMTWHNLSRTLIVKTWQRKAGGR